MHPSPIVPRRVRVRSGVRAVSASCYSCRCGGMLHSSVMHEFFQNEIGMAPASPIKLICGRDLSVVDCLGIMSLFVARRVRRLLPWRPARQRSDPESLHDSQPRPRHIRHHLSRESHVSFRGICHARQEMLAEIDNTSLEQEQLREPPSPDEATVTWFKPDSSTSGVSLNQYAFNSGVFYYTV